MLLVPLYEHPADRPEVWERLIASARRLHSVVLNPASGPGEAPDERFAAVAARLRDAGVPVLGYTDTDYGRRPHADVVQDLLRHRDWYAADGAFLDQAASGPELLPHYGRLTIAARAAGARTLVLNHGVHPHPGYAALADLLVTFEGPWDAYRDGSATPPPGPPTTRPTASATWSTPSRRTPRPPNWPPNGTRGSTAPSPAPAPTRGGASRTPWRPPDEAFHRRRGGGPAAPHRRLHGGP